MSIAQGPLTAPWAAARRGRHLDLAEYGHARVKTRRSAWERTHVRWALALDATAAACGVVVGLTARDVLFGSRADLWGPSGVMQMTLVVVAVAWLVMLAWNGAYALRFVGAGNEEYRAITRAAVGATALIGFTSFALQLELSRGVLLFSVPTIVVTTLVGRYALRRRLVRARSMGRHLRPTVVVGDTASALDVAQRIQSDPQTTGMSVVGICVSGTDDAALAALSVGGIRVLGREVDTLEIVDELGVAAVAVASSPTMAGQPLRRLGWALEQRNIDLLVAPGVIEVAGPRLSLRRAAGLPMVHVERPVSSGWRYAVKSASDRVIAATALVLLAPLLLLIGLVIRRDSAGPALFRQERVGEAGEIFSILKYRTMVVDADSKVSCLLDSSDGNGVLFKMRRDPRVTRVGQFLRRYSLDELPQLINVVRGEMSLVGPRPPLPQEVDEYESDAVRRLRARPGMTGLWQVSGRSDLSWVDSIRLDLWYVDNWSFGLDLQILVRTIKAVVYGQGAY
jgi:exopolysaccharide biosynthesis polyprenyl glycosylphosphotransferase